MADDIATLPLHVVQAAKDRARMRGHAAPPGTGPAGETCGSCRHYTVRHLAGTYRKCGLMRAYWTGGGGTDIRKKDPACSKWEAGE